MPTTKAGRNAIVYNPDTPGSGSSTPHSMLSFLRLLKQRYEIVLRHSPSGETPRGSAFRKHLKTLTFAEAFLEKGELIRRHPDHPLHIAVLGPTQAGKSSVVNWLMGRELAEVSPLAGYTVHPQGFAWGVEPDRCDGLDDYFRGYRRLARHELDHDRLDGYTLDAAPLDDARPSPGGSILWDTPDFDSVESGDYLDAVLRVAALADVVVLVVSKDKYADLSVWELMTLLEPLGQPTVIAINKIDAQAGRSLIHSIHDKWRASRRDAPPPIVAVPYQSGAAGLSGLTAERRQLLEHLHKACRVDYRKQHPAQVRRLIDRHWRAWTEPVRAEQRQQEEWEARIEDAVNDCLERYQRDYLDHPQHYETFQRALAELLTLLEIPGVGAALLAARRAVTWPLRQIAKLGRHVAGRSPHRESGEAAILHQLAEHAFIRLSENLLLNAGGDPVEQTWWREINEQVIRQKTSLLGAFDTGTRDYLDAFQPEVEKTARHLYEHLQQHPVVLNGLRATRVTTDAAALAMALHTGGIGVQDFVIAPAMLSVTTLLAESALGRYMNKAASQLKLRQKDAVTHLFHSRIVEPLAGLPARLDASSRLNIPPETLAAAEALRR